MKKLISRIETPLDCIFKDALSPDDIELPEDMEIHYVCTNDRLHILIYYTVENPEDILTLKNTIDDIVRALQLIEKSIPR
ncbi:conserved hypothetical protein [Pyrobaculum islandicum DSM 4184]|uniref:KEOPS complex Pcc1-like subunit n=1 Tax=Pyrobaculum islandicum (strain DSM 4184 / JCM 9189 / GEO3) TaxID=384616 RepID=A1RSM2_PYRIL|nr:KEOPS complex subunit Pcc1 [Pyrobaculum islandicum]ABL87954.1 conserved hypothetical protein [Pyrobaculum islandicum DSM 4184]